MVVAHVRFSDILAILSALRTVRNKLRTPNELLLDLNKTLNNFGANFILLEAHTPRSFCRIVKLNSEISMRKSQSPKNSVMR